MSALLGATPAIAKEILNPPFGRHTMCNAADLCVATLCMTPMPTRSVALMLRVAERLATGRPSACHVCQHVFLRYAHIRASTVDRTTRRPGGRGRPTTPTSPRPERTTITARDIGDRTWPPTWHNPASLHPSDARRQPDEHRTTRYRSAHVHNSGLCAIFLPGRIAVFATAACAHHGITAWRRLQVHIVEGNTCRTNHSNAQSILCRPVHLIIPPPVQL